MNLHRHRETELLRDGERLVRIVRGYAANHRDAECRQQCFRLDQVEHAPFPGEGVLDDELRAFAIRFRTLAEGLRHLQQQLLVRTVSGGGGESLYCRFGRGVSRQAVLAKQFPARRHRFVTHPAGEQRLLHLFPERDQAFRDGCRVRHGLRHHDRQYGVDALIRETGLDGACVLVGVRITQDVDGVVVRPAFSQQRI
jgi:hypothetical protein